MGFDTKKGMQVLEALADTIHQNKAYLSEIDGAIGDGDHGINMDKGFMLSRERAEGSSFDLSGALDLLGRILFSEIGGSMGPLYGIFYITMAERCAGKDMVDGAVLYDMLEGAADELFELGGAKVGDKTLMDTLIPAKEALKQAIDSGAAFEEALDAMQTAAIKGRDSTKELVAQIGRSARLGERSRGVLDAGAVSCCFMLCAMAEVMKANA